MSAMKAVMVLTSVDGSSYFSRSSVLLGWPPLPSLGDEFRFCQMDYFFYHLFLFIIILYLLLFIYYFYCLFYCLFLICVFFCVSATWFHYSAGFVVVLEDCCFS